MTASDVLIDTIHAWGVDVVFGLPGDGINGIMEALRIRQDKVRFIQVRHEESAAFMACAYAKHTGRLGCCLATSGPGGIHLLNGLYDAKLDGQPVLAITGLQYHDLIHTRTQQDVELDKLFVDVAHYNGTPSYTGPARGPDRTELGWKETVRMHPGEVTTVIMRFDLPKVPFTVPPSPRTGGHEYVWHCHILEHEEHDMMRPLVVK